MARLSDIPFSRMGEVLGGARESQRRRHATVRVAVEVDPTCPPTLVAAVREALVPETAGGLLHVGRVGAGPVRVNPDADAALVLAGDDAAGCARVSRAFRGQGVPCAVVALAGGVSGADAALGPAALGAEELGGAHLVVGEAAADALEALAAWLAEECASPIALAANFPFVRRAVTRRCVRAKAAQNAAIGLLPLGGADLPVMAANQALMALDVASAYGRGATVSRVAEVGAVMGAAFASRGLARAALRRLPGLGPVVRPLVAFGATALMGAAMGARFEVGERLGGRGDGACYNR